MAEQQPHLLVFSPLPPMPTGIGDYSYDLLPALAPFHRIIVVVEDAAPPLPRPPGCAVIRLAEYRRSWAAYADSLHLYMLGNNPDHVYLLPVLAARPGVVVLHDPGLHHLLDCATAALGDVDAYIAAIDAEYGPPGRLLAEQWRAHELRDATMVHGMPMLTHLLGPARHVVVHSRSAALKAMASAPEARITIAPHPYFPPPVPPDGAAIRARHGIGPNTTVFLSLGFVSHIKRVDTALRAIARLGAQLQDFRYIVAGAVRADEVDVLGLAARLGIADQVISTGYLPAEDLHGFIAAADVVINLRHPVSGETSGTLIRALGDGACVVVTDDGPFSELPDDAVVKLRWGPLVEVDLAAILLRLARDPDGRRAIGRNAARAIGQGNAIGRTVAAYRAAIAAATASSPPPWRSAVALQDAPPQQPPPQAATLWQALQAVPRLVPQGAVLALARASDRNALAQLGHHARWVDEAWWPGIEPLRAYDLVFLHLNPDSTLLVRPDLLAELNAITRFGGLVVLAIAGVAASAHSLAALAAGGAAFAQAGWRVDLAEGATPPGLAAPPPPAADTMVWRACKTSEPFRPLAAPAA